MSTEILESKILDLEAQLISIRLMIKYHKDILDSVESTFINVQLQKELAIEELRVHRNTSVSDQLTDRQLDIERFKIANLDLIKKI